jgi:hypothetical protein
MFCQKNFCIVAEVMLSNGFASTHLEKYSSHHYCMSVIPGAVGSGPTMSMPQRAKGHTGGISCISFEANVL